MGINMIKEIKDITMKQEICKEVLYDLPEWFGIEEATAHYIESVKDMVFLAAYDHDEVVGFYALREENKDTIDMYVLGIKKKYHGQGYGTILQERVFDYARVNNYKYALVLTLSKSHSDKGYAMTRDFYHKMGFVDIYESNKIWDEHNPTQIMIKRLGE